VIFGEVLPQSVCVRYGLQIGGYMSKPVLVMMYLLAPLAWPTAKLLDWLLGEDHGTVYKKSGLKTLVTLHKNLGEVSQRLNQDEVTIISAVLDLKEKPVANVMTPMEDVFVMAEDTVLDEPTMDMILSAGYSRIPIHETANPTNFVGMLLVKILITYDPEDCKLVRDFPLATLPETRPETSCLDIVNFFQEGKSHMVLVSEYPGEDHGALGVVTLEDVIEELIGEYVKQATSGEKRHLLLTWRREIIDESDVYIDVHKAIRRLTPAPKARVQRRHSEDPNGRLSDLTSMSDTALLDVNKATQTAATTSAESTMLSSSPKTATLMMRRSSAGLDGQFVKTTVPVRANFEDIREHLKHLGPSNPATNPNKTRSTTVKVKPGSGSHSVHPRPTSIEAAIEETPLETPMEDEGDERTSLLRPQMSGKDGVQALRQSYGSVSPAITVQLAPQTNGMPTIRLDSEEQADKSTQTSAEPSLEDVTHPDAAPQPQHQQPRQPLRGSSSGESATSMKIDNGLVPKKPYVRSGSITENVIESRGVRKVVLETTGSNDEEESAVIGPSSPDHPRLRGRGTFGLFGGRDSSKDSSKDGSKEVGQQQQQGMSQPTPVEERDEEEGGEEEGLMSPVPGDGEEEEEEAPGSYAQAAAMGTSHQGAQAGSSSGPSGGGGGGKKKNRRKKRKGGKS
jgi:metal transporter CNNM